MRPVMSQVDAESLKKGGVEFVDRLPIQTTPSKRGYQPANEEERKLDKKINLKLDSIVIVVLALDFLLQGIDKGNIGNAATSKSFAKDVHLHPDDVPNTVSLFSATFITCMPLSAMLGRYFGPKYWITFLMLVWGAITVAQMGMTQRSHLLALRLLLGVFEAGFVPTSYYYMSTLYPRYMAGFRLGMFAGMYAWGAAFSGLIAYGCLQIKSSKFHDWQLLFFIEGVVTLFFAIITFIAIPNKLSTAWMLTPEEREHAVRRIQLDLDDVNQATGTDYVDDDGKIHLVNLKDAFKDWRKLLIITFNICATTPVYGFTIFLPLIMKGFGYSGVDANLMSVSPFVVAAIGLYVIVWLSDRLHERSFLISSSMFIGVIDTIVFVASPVTSTKLRYGFVHIALIGAGSANPLVAAWISDNTPNKATRAILMGFFGWSNIAGIIAGQVYKSKYAPSYRVPIGITLAIVAFGMIGFLLVRVTFMWENRRRAKIIENWTEADYENERRDPARRGHMKRYFMYGY